MISKRVLKTAEGWLKKRDDLLEEERSALLDYLKPMKNVEALATARWFVNKVIRVPEDQPKVNEAIKVAKSAKVDPLTYSSPMNILNTFKQYKIKEKAIDPDTVPELSNGQTIGPPSFSIRVYDVEDTKEGQLAMRKIINTHWGEDANPWCLLQGDGKGNLRSDAWKYWNHYNGVPKRVAFKDSKLFAFCANDYAKDYWWNRQDEAHNGISFDMKMPNDELDREATYEMSGDGTLGNPTNIRRGNKQNGIYEKWYDNGQQWYRENRKDGKLKGVREEWHKNGQLKSSVNYNNGKVEGLFEELYDNGKVYRRRFYENGKLEGADTCWDENGDVIRTGFYKNNEADGLFTGRYDNGNMWFQTYFKDGERNGLDEWWREDGSLQSRGNYKNDIRDGLFEEWYENGQLEARTNYKNGQLEGVNEVWYPNGRMKSRGNYKDGQLEGLRERWNEDGQLESRGIYKDGWKDGVFEIWKSNGELYSRILYEKGNIVEDLTDNVKLRNYLAKVKDIVDEWRECIKEKTKKKITLKPKKGGGIKI